LKRQQGQLVLRVEKINDLRGFESLQPVWNSLLARSGASTIFLTWEWLHTWWRVFGEDRVLYILVVLENDEIIGIAPLLQRRVRHFGVSYRRLEILASGEDERDEICSEYLDFIIHRGREEESLEAILNYLHAHSRDWDEIVLKKVRADASVKHLPRLSASTDTVCQTTGNGHATSLSLPENWETVEKSLGKSFRQNLRNLRRRADTGGASFQVVETSAAFDEAFKTLMRLHQERWTQLGQPGVFSSEKFTRFHRDVCRLLVPKGQARLFQLTFEDHPVASLYAFVHDGEIVYYQSGFNPMIFPSYSFGTVLLSHAIEHSIKSGLSVWDFLSGSDDYKSRWGCRQHELISLRLSRRGAKETWYCLGNGCLQLLRSTKGRLRKTSVSHADDADASQCRRIIIKSTLLEYRA
jgi:CelD/BcsL family acetyltransferase involved in cellulose biosynthesis